MKAPDFSEFPVLETARLRLRRPVADDAADILIFRSDPEVMQYIPRPLATSIEDVKVFLNMMEESLAKNERINWAIEWKETGTVVGMISLVKILPEHARAEVGYSLSKAWFRKGICSEALEAVAKYSYNTLDCHSLEAIIDAENDASAGLLRHFGFRKEAYFLEDFFYGEHYRDSIHFGLLKKEWRVLSAGKR